ncbi:hypothetical protein YK48G_16680 [Lentilactobacillus fungorum]|uniref:DUF2975 domain-containing protein n=1 Tax=Lentilactobacillus fungorum TaxID=2201250 RepID=A0ABQ3W0R0_9LACO|nr:DUF2975 domain-containing protein [Lentilactobacillus fungorum]GHP14243.1 hypothetical protein YK48G_16680 [Lentilactobacillus fungorum]
MKIKTGFLKLALVGFGVIILLLCLFVFPTMLVRLKQIYTQITVSRDVFAGCLYLSAGLFFIAEGYAYQILRLVDQDNVFSGQALKAIKRIKGATGGMGVCYLLFLPMIYQVAQVEDAPGMIIMMALIAMIPLTVSTFAAILEKLLQKATELKLENQYTV